MEVEKQAAHWLDENHPNYKRWKRSRGISLQRGEFVKYLTEKTIKAAGLTVLDLGSGEGGTSVAFANNNKVISFDISLLRLQRQISNVAKYNKVLGSAMQLPFKNNKFDLIILQDVIEHLTDAKKVIGEISKILNPGGTIFMSTPNKYSLYNLLADPHWGFPFVAIMNRKQQKKYFLPLFRKSEINRTDTAQLFSLKELGDLLSDSFELELKTITAVQELFNGNKGIIWSNFHLRLLTIIKTLKLEKLVLFFVNNNVGIINSYFTPTFYFLLKKKQPHKNSSV
ncbi:MAG: methyltransferase domain-containing protein [Ignavibacteriaceae bacterium]|nr:methyltransferase domain-containing protein [Ignavibacteriaceae bacterium]